MALNRKTIIIGTIVIAILLIIGGFIWYKQREAIGKTITPDAPTFLEAKQITATEIKLTWKNNSYNEDGFKLYRNNELVGDLPSGTQNYTDTSLRPATTFNYNLKAYNRIGDSDSIVYSARTLNPPIRIFIEKIGVHENGEEGELLREYTLFGQPAKGEEYISIVVKDDKGTTENNLHYSLHRDEEVNVNLLIFDSKEVGEHLRLFTTAYEDDGGKAEQLAYQAMGQVAVSGFDMPISILLKSVGVDFAKIFADIFADLFGAGDDYMGSYGRDWDSTNNWGVSDYVDIGCKRENGNIGLRLWFKIDCPVYDYSLNRAISRPN